MTVLDAYALVAYLRGEAAANDVATLLRTSARLPAANAAEVVDQMVRVFGRDADDVHADLALLANAGMTIAPIDADLALLAGRLRARHYHRERMAVSLADCVAAATALSERRSLATADPALAELVRREGGKVHGLPDSTGRLP